MLVFFLFSLNLILVFAFSKNYFIKVLHVYLKMKINFEASANQMLLQYLSLKEDTKVSPFIVLSYGENFFFMSRPQSIVHVRTTACTCPGADPGIYVSGGRLG